MMDHQKDFHVSWNIDIVASSPEAAAEMALEIMRDANSGATVFMVHDGKTETRVDLSE